MTRLVRLLPPVLLALAALGGAAAAGAPAQDLPCGSGCTTRAARACAGFDDGDAPRHVRARATGCGVARRVAKAHWLVSGRFDSCAPRHRSCRVRGFRCERTGEDRRTVRCAADARRVAFRYPAP